MVSVWRLGMTVGYCPRLTEEVRPPGDYRTVATSGWLESPRARGIQRRRRVTSWTTAGIGVQLFVQRAHPRIRQPRLRWDAGTRQGLRSAHLISNNLVVQQNSRIEIRRGCRSPEVRMPLGGVPRTADCSEPVRLPLVRAHFQQTDQHRAHRC